MKITDDLFLRLVLGGTKAAGGYIELTDDALNAAIEIADKARAGVKRDKTKLTGEALDDYIAAARRILKEEQAKVDAGGKVLSRVRFAELLELPGESTVRMNKDLDEIYLNFKRFNSAKAPSTVNNDYDYKDDDDDF